MQAFRVLIASEDRATVVAFQQAMGQAEYEVHAVDNGSALLAKARECRPDLVFLDMDMPNDGAIEAFRAIKDDEEAAAIPVICVTAESFTEQVLETYNIEKCDYFKKPFTAREVLMRVEAQVELRRTREELKAKAAELQELNDKLANMIRIDPLTNLLNRRAWDEMVIQQHELFQRYGHPYGVVMVDVDHFRAFNDLYGHRAGDEFLRRVSEAILNVCRKADRVGRYGGEEFVVLAPETDADKAVQLADRIRRAIWTLDVVQAVGSSPVHMSASVGVSVSAASLSWGDVLRKAEDALHVAQRTGRNMVYADRGYASESTPASVAATLLQKKTEAQTGGAGNKMEVLVVDDEPTNRAVCKGCLQRVGYLVREAGDGHDALVKIGEHVPDVILMDVMMPGMDGLECTKKLRANPETRDIPIIILSALARTEDILAGLQAGADEYLSKPVRSSELVLRVQSMARLQRERVNLLNSYDERGKQMSILTRLVEYCREVSLCKRVDEVLRRTITTVADVMECRRVSIMLPDKGEQHLSIVSSIGMDDKLTKVMNVPLDAPIAGHVFASGQAVIVNTEAEAGARPDDYAAPYFASVPLLSAPLNAGGKVVGVVNATDKNGGVPFEARDLEYIELISKVAGTTIHDIHMREARDQASDSIMVGLASLAESRDNDTGKHLDRVTRFCLMLAETLQESDQLRDVINDEFLYKLERSVPLHDIGKVAIPDNILNFPGRLNDEQMAVMRTHAAAGAATIQSLISRAPGVCFLEMAADIARYHHERFDGKGYPDGLSGKNIPLAARIAAVADVYDALTTRRVYKLAFSHDKAMTIILEGSGSAFDPEVVEAFVQCEKNFADLAQTLADEIESQEEAAPQLALSAN